MPRCDDVGRGSAPVPDPVPPPAVAAVIQAVVAVCEAGGYGRVVIKVHEGRVAEVVAESHVRVLVLPLDTAPEPC